MIQKQEKLLINHVLFQLNWVANRIREKLNLKQKVTNQDNLLNKNSKKFAAHLKLK